MTKAKSTQPEQGKEELCTDEGCPNYGTPHVCLSKPAQPQLPPLKDSRDWQWDSGGSSDGALEIVLSQLDERERQLLSALAENESLKAQLAEWLKQNNPGGRIDDLRAERDAVIAELKLYKPSSPMEIGGTR